MPLSSVCVPDDIFQFTPLREGRHYIPIAVFYANVISIHAPPRGATRRVCAL